MISLAQGELSKIGPDQYEKRLITSHTFSLDSKRLEEFKQVIHKFMDESTQTFEAQTESSDIYQFNIQLFPLIKN